MERPRYPDFSSLVWVKLQKILNPTLPMMQHLLSSFVKPSLSGKHPPSKSQFVSFWFKIYSRQDQAEILSLFNIDWVELQLHTPWPNFVSLMTPLMFPLCTSSVTGLTNIKCGCSPGLRSQMADNYSSHCVSCTFCTVSPPQPCPFYPSFPAAFFPLNQSRVRFREEVNTLVLWLGPFLQRGLYNWKALVGYFKTLVGTDSHVCAMAGNGALSFSLSFTDC